MNAKVTERITNLFATMVVEVVSKNKTNGVLKSTDGPLKITDELAAKLVFLDYEFITEDQVKSIVYSLDGNLIADDHRPMINEIIDAEDGVPVTLYNDGFLYMNIAVVTELLGDKEQDEDFIMEAMFDNVVAVIGYYASVEIYGEEDEDGDKYLEKFIDDNIKTREEPQLREEWVKHLKETRRILNEDAVVPPVVIVEASQGVVRGVQSPDAIDSLIIDYDDHHEEYHDEIEQMVKDVVSGKVDFSKLKELADKAWIRP